MFKFLSRSRDLTIRWKSSVVEKALQYKTGDRLHSYTVKKVAEIPELSLAAVTLTHDETGAHHFHIARDDTDNVFGVGFRTTPMDDTGVPHILEHTVLCGSEMYPVRDPFFKMLNRSQSTFMNAFTSSDWTMYPFSSQNEQDFRNLLSVYLDAVFFPKLRELDFRQEGWRLEHEDIQNKDSPIVFKGVVFNEMKGVYSSSESIFTEKCQNLLQPSHTYSVCYGGDPPSIPKLTWEALKDFHASHYHPSNARFYTYGSVPLEKHLEYIQKHALQKFSRINPGTEVPLEPKWGEPREAKIDCHFDPLQPDKFKQTTVAVSFLLADVTDPFENFTLQLLGHLLTGSEKAPFYKALIESNIGSGFAPEHGFSGHTRQSKFSIGLQMIKEDDTDKVKQIIDTTIAEVIRNGFEEKQIESVLHKVELSVKHEQDKFGLNLGVSVMYGWNHDADPTNMLLVNQHTERFKKCLQENPKFLQDKVQYYFKDNPHKLTLVMTPTDDFAEKRTLQESQLLENMVSRLTDQDKADIYEKGIELAELQSQAEDVSCLPSLKVSDIDKKGTTVAMESYHIDGTPIYYTAQPTNGMTYFRAVSSIADLPKDLTPYIPLFCGVVTKLGAGTRDFREQSEEIDLKTAGLTASPHVSEHHTESGLFEQGVLFSSLCLDKNTEAMFELWKDIFHSLNTSDTMRLKQLIMMQSADLANSIVMAGHSYAMTHASSALNSAGRQRELFSGMTQVGLMKTIAEMEVGDLDHIVKIIQDIGHHVLNRHMMRCSINVLPEAVESTCKLTENFVKSLYHPLHDKPEKLNLKHLHFYDKDSSFVPHPHNTHFELPFQVNYVAKSMKTVPLSHPDFASLRVLSKLLTFKFLHREIREKGGAYGGGALTRIPEVFNFFSYRDPNSSHTLDSFDRAVEWAMKGDFTQEDIDESKLGLFQESDMPIPPGRRGTLLFLHDISDEMKQAHREQIFAVSKQNLVDVVQRYLTPENRQQSVTFLGPENKLSSNSESWIIKKQH